MRQRVLDEGGVWDEGGHRRSQADAKQQREVAAVLAGAAR